MVGAAAAMAVRREAMLVLTAAERGARAIRLVVRSKPTSIAEEDKSLGADLFALDGGVSGGVGLLSLVEESSKLRIQRRIGMSRWEGREKGWGEAGVEAKAEAKAKAEAAKAIRVRWRSAMRMRMGNGR